MRSTGSALLGLLLASCAITPSGPPLPLTAHSLFDDYLLVHGLAEGTVQSATVGRTELLEIVRLDHAALGALSGLASDNSDAQRRRAQAAIASLAEYAEAVSTRLPVTRPALSRSGIP